MCPFDLNTASTHALQAQPTQSGLFTRDFAVDVSTSNVASLEPRVGNLRLDVLYHRLSFAVDVV